MMSKDVVRVDVRELLATGQFGLVQLGVDWAEVLRLLGQPVQGFEDDGFGRGWCCYGNLGFVFRRGVLEEVAWEVNVTTYEPSWPAGDDLLLVEPWELWSGLSCAEAEAALEAVGIEFKRVDVFAGENGALVGLVTAGGGQLLFEEFVGWSLTRVMLRRGWGFERSEAEWLEYWTY